MTDHNGRQGLALRARPTAIPARDEWDDAKRALLARTIAKGATSDELELFVAVCRRTGLDPFAKQIYAIKRRDVLSIQVGIDGYRLVAERTGKYGGQLGPMWLDADGQWRDYWVETGAPTAARVGIVRTDWQQPVWVTARYQSYQQDTPLWRQMPEVMLAKCAEGLAFRKAFPMELSGYQQVAPELEVPEVARRVDEEGVVHEEPGPPSRARAIAAELDAAIAEADAVGMDPPPDAVGAGTEYEREQPPAGPRWAATPLGRQVSALVDALTAAGKRFSPPPDDADEATLKGWISSKRAALGPAARA